MTRAAEETLSPLASMALEQAERCDLDPAPIYRTAVALQGGDLVPVFELGRARLALVGRLDALPGDLATTLALGIVAVALWWPSSPAAAPSPE